MKDVKILNQADFVFFFVDVLLPGGLEGSRKSCGEVVGVLNASALRFALLLNPPLSIEELNEAELVVLESHQHVAILFVVEAQHFLKLSVL